MYSAFLCRYDMKYFFLLLFSFSLVAQDLPKPDFTMALWPDKPQSAANADVRKKTNIVRITKVSSPALELFKSKTAAKLAPAVLVFPGGAYNILAYDHEGTQVAEWLNAIGIHAIVVKYTVPGNKRQEALQDVQRAMGLVRSKAAEWGIDQKKIGVLGFSAGGHLSAHLSTNYQKRAYELIDAADELSCRPDFTVLVYPAYLYTNKDRKVLASEIKVDAHTPPAFIVQALNDKNFIDSSFNYCRALKDAKVAAEMHLYASGGHGHGLRESKHAISHWPKLCGDWIKSITK